MDLDDVRAIIATSRADVWALIDAAISVAALDHADELKFRRDAIVERLYSHSNPPNNAAVAAAVAEGEHSGGDSPLTPQSVNRNDDDVDDDDEQVVGVVEEGVDPCGGLFDDDEEARILGIKQQLEDPRLSDESIADLLQSLADMDLTFKTLRETDIGRNVNRLRKHPSNEIRGLVKELVRKWKDLVDEWVGSKHTQDAPIIRYGSSGSEPEQKPNATIPRRDSPSKPLQKFPASSSAPPPNKPHKETNIDLDKLASARRRLHENYQEAKNAKKQRTIQVMDIHEIPKPKNGFIAKNKGGFQGRHHR